jgi:serine/threonine protein kinase
MSKVFTITEGLENMGALRTGGQGSVYKGRRIGPIISAVKLLPTPIHTENTDDKNYRNFLNEVDKLKKVNEVPNPNVVKIINSGITDSGSFPFIEMEYIEGPDLGDLLNPPNDKLFTLKQVVKLADQLACALAHCHKVGVKHGDIKSNNIKFNVHSGNYVLLDFGLSIMSDEERRTSMRHAGAIEFMAPEQNEGKMLFQTDIYSYGVILYELLAGQVPFPLKDNGETARNTVMVAHMESPVPDLLHLRKENIPSNWSKKEQDNEMNVPDWSLKLVYKCLEKSPENRYADGVELHDAIIKNSIADIRENVAPAANDQVEEQEAAMIADAGIINQPVSSNMMLISKPVFAMLMVLLLVSIGYAAYSLFNKPAQQIEITPKTAVDSSKNADSVAAINKIDNSKVNRKRKRLTDSMTKAAINVDIEKSKTPNKTDSVAVDTAAKKPAGN